MVDLDAVVVDDAMIDDIAARLWAPATRNRFAAGRGAGPAAGSLRSTDPVADLLITWRQELAILPMPPPLSARQIETVLERSQARPRRSVRVIRPGLSVAAAIAALVVGSATVGSKDAGPDSPLWGITQVLWPDHAESTASRFEARDALAEAQIAIAAGNERQARLALSRAEAELGKVEDVDARGTMQQQMDDLRAQAGVFDADTARVAAEQPAVQRPSASAGPASSAPPTTPGPSTSLDQLAAALPAAAPTGAIEQFLTASPLVQTTRPTSVNVAPPLLMSSPTGSGSSGVAAATPTTDSAGPEASGTVVDPTTVSSPPSSVPVPSVPLAPTTPMMRGSPSPSAPAQTGPMPTPSSPGASPATDAPVTVTTTPAASSSAVSSSAQTGVGSAPLSDVVGDSATS